MKRKEKMHIKTQNKTELVGQIDSINGQIQKMRIDRYTKAVKNVREIRNLKRKLAILKTMIHQISEA